MEKTGEIDTKPIHSVQACISLFDSIGDHNKHKLTGSNGYEKGSELEEVVKDLANYKVQLEAKDAAYMQALLRMEQQQKTIHELSKLLKIADVGRDKYANDCCEARMQLSELELKLNEMTDQSMETEKVRERLEFATNELKIRQKELLGIETELDASRESEVKGITEIGLVENNPFDLARHISELNEAICMTEKEMSVVLSAKDAELELAMEKVVELQRQLEERCKKTDLMHDLESQLLAKTLYIDMLESRLKQTNELESSCEKTSFDDLGNLKQIKEDLAVVDRECSDRSLYIESLEMERNQLKEEVKNANEEIEKLKDKIEPLKNQLERMKLETKERENKAEVEIAMLKSELNKGRSKVAAAEAAEAKDESVRSDLYLAVQDLAAEAAEVKKENIKLKQGPFLSHEETENSVLAKPLIEKTSSTMEEDLNLEVNEKSVENFTITITMEEYQSLTKNVVPTSDLSSDNFSQFEKLKKELEAAMIRIGEFRSRAEQAATRAEMAEKAKEAVEEQLRKWREHKQRRKAAFAAMKEASEPPKFKPPMYDEGSSKVYQPLGWSRG